MTMPKPNSQYRKYLHVIHSAEYSCWKAMKTRCTNPNVGHFKNYGGRGILVCEKWLKSFESFLQDVGKRPSRKHDLDRINNDGDYEPGNVRWALRFENLRNKRRSAWPDRPRIIELNQQGVSQRELADGYGLHQSTISRIICGKIRSAKAY